MRKSETANGNRIPRWRGWREAPGVDPLKRKIFFKNLLAIKGLSFPQTTTAKTPLPPLYAGVVSKYK